MDSELHSFGGHAMDRHVFDLDTDDGAGSGSFDAGGAAAPSPDAAQVAAPDTGATGEPDTSAGATAPAAPPADPGLDPRQVQAELDYLRQQNAELAQFLQQGLNTPAQVQQGAPGLPDFDPLDPDSVRAYNDARDQQMLHAMQEMLGQVTQPLQQQQHAQQVSQLTETVYDLMEDNISRHGDFVTGAGPEAEQANSQARTLVDTLAANLYPQMVQRYGPSPAAMEQALTVAADQVRGLLRAAGVGAQQQQANQLATLAGAHGEPGIGSGSGAPVTPAARVGGESLAMKYAQRANAAA